MAPSICKLSNRIKLCSMILIAFLLLVSLAIKNSELLFGAILGGFAGLFNFILLSRFVREISRGERSFRRKVSIASITLLRYGVITLSLLAGMLISENCLIFVLIALILPQLSMVILPLFEKDSNNISS